MGPWAVRTKIPRKTSIKKTNCRSIHLISLILSCSQFVTILRELELKMKADILERMKRKGTAAPTLTESDIDLDLNYPSDIESR